MCLTRLGTCHYVWETFGGVWWQFTLLLDIKWIVKSSNDATAIYQFYRIRMVTSCRPHIPCYCTCVTGCIIRVLYSYNEWLEVLVWLESYVGLTSYNDSRRGRTLVIHWVHIIGNWFGTSRSSHRTMTRNWLGTCHFWTCKKSGLRWNLTPTSFNVMKGLSIHSMTHKSSFIVTRFTWAHRAGHASLLLHMHGLIG